MLVNTPVSACCILRFCGLCGWSEKWTRILFPRPFLQPIFGVTRLLLHWSGRGSNRGSLPAEGKPDRVPARAPHHSGRAGRNWQGAARTPGPWRRRGSRARARRRSRCRSAAQPQVGRRAATIDPIALDQAQARSTQSARSTARWACQAWRCGRTRRWQSRPEPRGLAPRYSAGCGCAAGSGSGTGTAAASTAARRRRALRWIRKNTSAAPVNGR